MAPDRQAESDQRRNQLHADTHLCSCKVFAKTHAYDGKDFAMHLSIHLSIATGCDARGSAMSRPPAVRCAEEFYGLFLQRK
eukprot:g29758.t1